MKRMIKIRFATIACVLGLTMAGAFSARGQTIDPTASRTWRAYGGFSVKAGFVELKGNDVVLKGEDGNVLSVSLLKLIPEDQAFARELGARVTTVGTFATKAAVGSRLAEFADGPAKGNFALYENENFIVRITSDARIMIQCLEAGKPVGKPIEVLMGHLYQDTKIQGPRRRAIVSFAEAYQPVLQPDIVKLEGVLVDNIPFGFTIAFEKQSVHISGWVEDPNPKVYATDYNPAFKFAASHSFEAHVLVADQKKALKPFWLEINPLKGKAFTQAYGDWLQGGRGPLRTVNFKGAVFGSRNLSIAVGTSRLAEMHVVNVRADIPLYSGFQVSLQKKNPALRDPSCRITLTID